MNIDAKMACYLLNRAESIGPKTVLMLKKALGSFEACIMTDPDRLHSLKLINEKQTNSLKQIRRDKENLLSDYFKYKEIGIKIYTYDDPEYPKRLKNISSPPFILYVKGNLPKDDVPSAAIIGARECSSYGLKAAEYFSENLSMNGVQIISGLAYGIDAAASRGALGHGTGSFAVLGSGVNVCYPKENYPLYIDILNDGDGHTGGIISEFYPAAKALPHHFVMRNRIIAGLSDVLLVIEARERSGTSITVGYALEQGKDVFAMPGRIDDPLGRGCNKLIKDGAFPLTEPEDILSYLGISSVPVKTLGEKELSNLSIEEKDIYLKLGHDPIHIDELSEQTKAGRAELINILFSLELKGYLVNVDGSYYMLS